MRPDLRKLYIDIDILQKLDMFNTHINFEKISGLRQFWHGRVSELILLVSQF